MKKVIKGKRYDTDTAVEVGSGMLLQRCSDGIDRPAETLYRKRTGELFLLERLRHGAGIYPMGYDEARAWAEENMDADGYGALFGEVGELEGNVPVTLSIPASAKAKLERRAAQAGLTQSAIVAELIAGL